MIYGDRIAFFAPLRVSELEKLKDVGIGTFKVFQETYHHETYRKVHPQGTIKGHYRWHLHAMDRAQEAKVDDNGLGVLFGLYDWRFALLNCLKAIKNLINTNIIFLSDSTYSVCY